MVFGQVIAACRFQVRPLFHLIVQHVAAGVRRCPDIRWCKELTGKDSRMATRRGGQPQVRFGRIPTVGVILALLRRPVEQLCPLWLAGPVATIQVRVSQFARHFSQGSWNPSLPLTNARPATWICTNMLLCLGNTHFCFLRLPAALLRPLGERSRVILFFPSLPPAAYSPRQVLPALRLFCSLKGAWGRTLGRLSACENSSESLFFLTIALVSDT